MEKQLTYVSDLKEYVLFLMKNYLEELIEENIQRGKIEVESTVGRGSIFRVYFKSDA